MATIHALTGPAQTAAAVVIAVALVPARSSTQAFVDVTTASGVEAVRDTKPQDWWLSGIHLVDLDGDGDLDLFLSCHNSAGLAALNDGHGVFALANGNYPKTELHIAYDIDENGRSDISMTYGDRGGQWWRNGSTPDALAFYTSTGEPAGAHSCTATRRGAASATPQRRPSTEVLPSVTSMATVIWT